MSPVPRKNENSPPRKPARRKGNPKPREKPREDPVVSLVQRTRASGRGGRGRR